MQDQKNSGIKKTITELCEKKKKALLSYWAKVKPAFQKHGDKLLFVLALAILAAALFNLVGKKAITQAAAPSIVFTQWWQDNLEKDTLQTLIKEFESIHGDIKIVIKDRSYEDLRQDLFNPSETSFPGDILALDPLWVPELLAGKTIETQEAENQRTFDPAQSGSDAPLLSFIDVLYYNVEILKEAGFTKPPKTRGEFIDCLKTLTNTEKGRWGLAMDRNSSRGIYDDVFPWIWSAGAQLIKDGKPVVTSRPVVESLSFLASLNSEGFIIPGTLHEGKLEDFISGRAAFMIAPEEETALVWERMGDQAFGVSSVPTPDNYAGKTFFASAGWTLGINSASAHKEEARLFADFLAGHASLLSEKAGAIPGNGNPSPSTDPFYSKTWDITIAAEPARDFTGLPWTELEEIFKEELDALFEERSTPAGTAAAIQERWDTVLAGM